MPATPTGLLEKANDAQVTLQGDASLTGLDLEDRVFKYTAPSTNWVAGKVKV